MSNALQDFLGDVYDPSSGEFNYAKAEASSVTGKPRFNVILVGATGAGKSSLVNAVFGDCIVKSGLGNPVTQKLEKIVIEKKGMVLWDTKGIEAKDYEGTIEQLKAEISLEFSKAENHYDLPHFCWLCIDASSGRVEPRDIELIKIIKEYNIPIVVIFTKAMGDSESLAFSDIAKREINIHYEEYIAGRFVSVNSVPKVFEHFTIPTIGLGKLLEDTMKCISDNMPEVELAFKKAQNVKMDMKLDAMKSGARNIVHLASIAAGSIAFTPIPGSDAPLISAVQGAMVYKINSEFELEISVSSSSSIVAGILGATALAQVGKAVVANVLKLIPAVGTVIGGTVSAATATALTQAVGHAYISVLECYFDKNTGEVNLPENTKSILDTFAGFFSVAKTA